MKSINEQWSARIFSKTTTSYTSLWDSVIHDVAPKAPQITSALDTSGGVAISYTFDLSPAIHWQQK